MSGASESVSRMPRRMRAWSSQRKTLIMSGLASYVGPLARVVRLVGRLRDVGAVVRVERHGEDERGSLRAARQVDPAADRRRALVQAADAEGARLRQVFLAEAATVVADLERKHAAGQRQVDANARRLRVLADAVS